MTSFDIIGKNSLKWTKKYKTTSKNEKIIISKVSILVFVETGLSNYQKFRY